MKPALPEHELVAESILLETLKSVDVLKVVSSQKEQADVSHGYHPDLRVRVKVGGTLFDLVIEVLKEATPRKVESAILQLEHHLRAGHVHPHPHYPVVIAPWFSEASQEVCKKHRAGYVDFTGNCRLTFGTVFLERSRGTGKKGGEGSRKAVNLFTPKTSRILRKMLDHPHQWWSVQDLSLQAQVSLGRVSSLKKQLLEENLLEQDGAGFRLEDPAALLERWMKEHPKDTGVQTVKLHALHPRKTLEEHLRTLQVKWPSLVALRSASAADHQAPFLRHPTLFVYLGKEALHLFESDLKLREVDRGENIEVRIIQEDDLTFDRDITPNGQALTHPILTLLELTELGERGREAAEHLKATLMKGWSR